MPSTGPMDGSGSLSLSWGEQEGAATTTPVSTQQCSLQQPRRPARFLTGKLEAVQLREEQIGSMGWLESTCCNGCPKHLDFSHHMCLPPDCYSPQTTHAAHPLSSSTRFGEVTQTLVKNLIKALIKKLKIHQSINKRKLYHL